MKSVYLAAAAMAALTAGARAADLPVYEPAPVVAPVPAYSWTGFYVGAHGGYAFGDDDDNILVFDTDLDGDFDDIVIDPVGGGDAFAPGFESDFDDGIDVGIRAGYDWQFGSFLLGGVVDLSYVNVEDSTTGFSVTPAFYTFERELEWLATARLRAGFAVDRFLVYGTGGIAYGRFDHSFSTNSPAVLESVGGADDDAWGYTIGAGAEMLVTQRISVGFEYLYTDLDADAETARFSGGAFGAGTDMRPSDDDFDLHSIRATVSYRF